MAFALGLVRIRPPLEPSYCTLDLVPLKGVPSVTPLSQVYVLAPLPVSVVELPTQMVAGLAFATTVGRLFTLILTESVQLPIPSLIST